MIKSEAIALANEIVEAQKIAQLNKVPGGVFICIDTSKGKYQFIPLEDAPYGNTILKEAFNKQNATISLLERKNKALQLKFEELEKKLVELRERTLQAVQILDEKIDRELESGDPL
ncbi:MAG: hypothetical protein EOM77_05700 [Bacteroidia bacterium]|nr:hypothetical protein [Bacteroidia bacterium]